MRTKKCPPTPNRLNNCTFTTELHDTAWADEREYKSIKSELHDGRGNDMATDSQLQSIDRVQSTKCLHTVSPTGIVQSKQT